MSFTPKLTVLLAAVLLAASALGGCAGDSYKGKRYSRGGADASYSTGFEGFKGSN